MNCYIFKKTLCPDTLMILINAKTDDEAYSILEGELKINKWSDEYFLEDVKE